MKRIYADLHMRADFTDKERLSCALKKAASLGYRLLSIPIRPDSKTEEIQRVINLCKEVEVDFASRTDLTPKTPRELIYSLRKLRRRFEIIAVSCQSQSVARQAAKDRRVDLLNFPLLDFHERFFDHAEAALASRGLASLEIDIEPLFTLGSLAKISLLSSLRRETQIAKDHNVPIVISSGVSNQLLMRRPTELGWLASLFDLDEITALDAVSINPLKIVRRNREKLSPRFVAPGIRIVRKGENC